MTTKQLLQKCVNKDRTAWDEFIKSYTGIVIRSVRYKLKKLNARLPCTDINDIVQEIFLYIWSRDKLSGVKNTDCLRGWLAIVSINFTSNYCKKSSFKNTEKTLSLDAACPSDGSGTPLGSIIPSSKLNTSRMLETNELKNILETEISKLGHKQQLALKFNLYDGKRHKDIAAIMNIPESTVTTLINRGKAELRRRLKKYGDI